MIGNTTASSTFLTALMGALTAVATWTEEDADVYLVEGDFDPSTPGTYPAASTAFAEKTSDDVWSIEFDAVTNSWKLILPEPAGGWDFVSTGSGVTITGFVIKAGTTSANKIGAAKFETPIAITATDQHIELPFVAFDISSLMVSGENPYPLT